MFLTPLVPVRVATKVPKPAPNKTLPDPFVRVEFGGGRQVNLLEYDLDTILYGYAEDEAEASLLCRTGFAHMCAATGSHVNGWYVGWARSASLPHASKSTDPKVSLPRYRAMVTWRVQGQPIP